jgi:hypothetical protein
VPNLALTWPSTPPNTNTYAIAPTPTSPLALSDLSTPLISFFCFPPATQEVSRADALAAASEAELKQLNTAAVQLRQTLSTHSASFERVQSTMNAMLEQANAVKRGQKYLQLVKVLCASDRAQSFFAQVMHAWPQDIESVSVEARASVEAAAAASGAGSTALLTKAMQHVRALMQLFGDITPDLPAQQLKVLEVLPST